MTEEDIEVCSFYVAHLFRRSLSFRLGSSTMYASLNRATLRIANGNLLLRQYAAKVSLATRTSVSLPLLREAIYRACAKHETPSGVQSAFVDDLDRGTRAFASRFAAMKWSVLISNSPENFVISDAPVISKQRGRAGIYGLGLAKPEAEWFLPISPRVILCAGHERRYNDNVEATEARDLNLAQIHTMTNKLYSSTCDLWLDSFVQAYSGKYKYFIDVFRDKNLTTEEKDLQALLRILSDEEEPAQLKKSAA